jgi:hypothetical protein
MEAERSSLQLSPSCILPRGTGEEKKREEQQQAANRTAKRKETRER